MATDQLLWRVAAIIMGIVLYGVSLLMTDFLWPMAATSKPVAAN